MHVFSASPEGGGDAPPSPLKETLVVELLYSPLMEHCVVVNVEYSLCGYAVGWRI